MSATTEQAGKPGAGNGGAAHEPDDLERKSSEIRADMDRTLDALERRFSPGMLLDRSLEYLREHGGGLTQRVGETVRNNPVPALMTAAGVIWLTASIVANRRKSDEGSYALPVQDTYSGEQEDSSSGALDTNGERGKGNGRQKGNGRGRLRTLGRRVHDRVEATRERIRSSRHAAGNKMSERLHGAMDATRERARNAQDRMYSVVDDQPLVMGALAVAVGAVIGALLPVTEYENRAVGPLRDRTLAKAKQAGEQQYDNLRNKLENREDVQVSGGRTN